MNDIDQQEAIESSLLLYINTGYDYQEEQTDIGLQEAIQLSLKENDREMNCSEYQTEDDEQEPPHSYTEYVQYYHEQKVIVDSLRDSWEKRAAKQDRDYAMELQNQEYQFHFERDEENESILLAQSLHERETTSLENQLVALSLRDEAINDNMEDNVVDNTTEEMDDNRQERINFLSSLENPTYEQCLELEELIGTVRVSLTEEEIRLLPSSRLKNDLEESYFK